MRISNRDMLEVLEMRRMTTAAVNLSGSVMIGVLAGLIASGRLAIYLGYQTGLLR